MDPDGNRLQNRHWGHSTMHRVPPVSGTTTTICSLLPGNQILISKYLARRGVVVSGGWSNGSRWQQTTTTMCRHACMHTV